MVSRNLSATRYLPPIDFARFVPGAELKLTDLSEDMLNQYNTFHAMKRSPQYLLSAKQDASETGSTFKGLQQRT